MQKPFWHCDSLRPTSCIYSKSMLFANIPLGSYSSRYTIFSQSLINVDFFTSGIDPDILKSLKITLYSLFA